MDAGQDGKEASIQKNRRGSTQTECDTIVLVVEGESSIKLMASKRHLYEQGSYFKAMENFREGNQPEIVLKLPPGLETCTELHEASPNCECIMCRLLPSAPIPSDGCSIEGVDILQQSSAREILQSVDLDQTTARESGSRRRADEAQERENRQTAMPPPSTSMALQLLQAADYFGFAEVISSTVQLLDDRLETDCLQIQGALEIPELEDLKKRAEKFSLCLFVCLGSTALNCGGPADPFLNCSLSTLRELMANPKLNCSSESVLRAILQHWSTVTGAEGRLVEELVERWKKVERQLPLFPCVMGQRRARRGELKRRGTEGGGACRRGEAALLAFNPVSGEWKGGMDIGCESCLDSTGFKAASAECGDFVCKNGELCEYKVYNGQVRCSVHQASTVKSNKISFQVVISGGEHHLGHSQWSRDIWLIDTLRSCHKKIGDGVLERGRRHHAAVLACCKLFLIGGYGRHRDPLASVEVFDLASKEVRPCASLPHAVRRPAAAIWMNQLVVVAEGDGDGGNIFAYKDDKDVWERLAGPILPQGVDRCVAASSIDGDLYLTSTFSRTITRVSYHPGSYKLKSMGTFSKEAGNVCMVGSRLYNFYSEEFGDERVVESFDTETGLFTVHLNEELPQWDFSPAPQYSYGCFPILAYSL